MIKYVLRRLIQMLVILRVVLTAVFLFLHVIPGDPAVIILGGVEGNPTLAQIKAVREELGLNDPLYVQYFRFLGKTLTGDLGRAFVGGHPVASTLLRRIPRTFQLILPAILLAALVGIPAGAIAAMHRGKRIDPIISIAAIVGYSTPPFIVGTLLVLVFAIYYPVLPPSGFASLTSDFARSFVRSILPVITLAIAPTAMTMRMSRSSVLECLHTDYVTTARAKGISEAAVVFKHVIRNSLVPVVTVLGLQIGSMFGGSVVVEMIFNWPGVSQLLIDSIERRDYPVVQGVVLIVAVFFLLVNLITDLSYASLDPRILYD